MKNKLYTGIAGFVMLAFVVLPNLSSAATVDELQAQINTLLAQIKSLQEQLATVQQGATQQWCHDFNINLKVGDSNAEVSALKTALQKEGFDSSTSMTFDEDTASAVSGFQQKYADEILTPLGLKYGTGFVGPSTRAKLNKLYGCGIKVLPPTTTPIPPVTTTPTSPTTPSVTVTSPNGGEVWKFGTPQTIKWVSSGIKSGTLGLYLMTTNGEMCSIGSPDALAGTFTTTLQENQTCSGNPYYLILKAGQYKVAIDAAPVTGIENSGDTSNAPFSIVAAGTLVFSQNAFNFSYTQGGNAPVMQSLTFNNTSNATINYTISVPNQPSWLNTRYNTATLPSYPNSPTGLGALANPVGLNPGTYTTNIIISGNFSGSPKTIPVTLMITAAVVPAPTATLSITVLSPNGRETWEVGKNYSISWKTDTLSLPVYSSIQVDILDTRSGKTTAQIGNFNKSTSNIQWTVSNIKWDGNVYKILVRVLDGDRKEIARDASDAPFSIVTAPTSSILGDVDENGKVDVNDSLFIAQYVTGKRTFTSAQLTAADVNKDGKVSTNDARIISLYDVGKFTSLPVTSVKVGDIDKSGTITSGDALLVTQYLAGTKTFDAIQEAAADVNNDNVITQADADAILSASVGIKELPTPYVAPVTTSQDDSSLNQMASVLQSIQDTINKMLESLKR